MIVSSRFVQVFEFSTLVPEEEHFLTLCSIVSIYRRMYG